MRENAAMSSYQRNVIVGAVVLVGLGMLAWMILQFANKAASFFLTSGTKITLNAPRAEGIADGSPVTYKGVNVGRVTGVRRVLNPKSPGGEDIIIDALIKADPPLPANLHGRIKQTSLLGGSSQIALEPVEVRPSTGPANGSVATRVGTLAENANLQADFVPDIASLGDNIRDLTVSIQDIIGDPKVKDNIKVSLANIRATTESAATLGKKLESLSDKFDKGIDNANGTMTDMRATVKDVRGEIKRMSDSLNQRLQQVAESLQHVQSIAAKLDIGEGTAGKLINDEKLYQNLSETAEELNLMVKDMRRLIQQWEQEGIIKL
jgi:phospholipid/cholesterol/gamma-HCH transport system substrate-binding protein